MPEERVQRRLAAILAADVVGYSRMMGADEAGTLARLTTLRRELLHPKVEAYGGRVVKTTGDGTLIEFPSAVDAVRHAVDIQQELARRNADLPDRERMEFRMGINVGDIIVEDDDIFGDGVNVAARLENIAKPEGVTISANVHEQVRAKLDLRFEDLGEQAMKNIAEPVHAYRIDIEPTVAPKTDASAPPRDKPSIAVLPFDNMSGDPEQEYFADGIAEDIITALSHFRWFFVIARNSSFTYRGRAVDVKQVARELGVQYVLEGSVRKGGNRVRITAQLVEALTGRHVWAERYDRELDDIFAVQDEITKVIVGAVAPSFVSAEARRVERNPPSSLDIWDSVMRGNWHLWRQGKDDLAEARRLFQSAIERDPACAPAHSGLAMACFWAIYYGFSDSPEEARAIGTKAARTAVSLDENDAMAHVVQGMVHLLSHRLDDAASSLGQAVHLNESLVFAEGGLAMVEAYRGNDDEALLHAERAESVNPRDPLRVMSTQARAHVAMVRGQYGEAASWCRKSIEASPSFTGAWRLLAACLAHDDRLAEAKEAIDELLRLSPNLTLEACRRAIPAARDVHRELYVEGLRKAGMPA